MWGFGLALSGACLATCRAEPDRPFCEPGLACATASETACATGPEAVRHGRSTFLHGSCVAFDPAQCEAASLTCAVWGQCHAPPPDYTPTGACDASSDRDFLASRNPACTLGTCLAQESDCQKARVCALEGRCSARNGVCVADDRACKASELCLTLGACALVGSECRPGSAADCQRSRACLDYANCALSGGRCVACDRSSDCRERGLCERVGRQCLATADPPCRASAACRKGGLCRAFRGACVK